MEEYNDNYYKKQQAAITHDQQITNTIHITDLHDYKGERGKEQKDARESGIFSAICMNANLELTERDVGFLAHCLLDNDPNIKRILDGEEPETLSCRATGNQRPKPGQASDTPYSKKLHKIRKEGFLNEY